MSVTETEMEPEQPSGRQLDKFVAERVMGWTDCVYLPRPDYFAGFPPMSEEAKRFHVRTVVPRYSESIEAAMLVVEKMWQKGWQMEAANHYTLGTLISQNSCSWWVRFINQNNDLNNWSAEGETLSEAICLAALKAMESESAAAG